MSRGVFHLDRDALVHIFFATLLLHWSWACISREEKQLKRTSVGFACRRMRYPGTSAEGARLNRGTSLSRLHSAWRFSSYSPRVFAVGSGASNSAADAYAAYSSPLLAEVGASVQARLLFERSI